MAQKAFPHLALLSRDACRSKRVSGLLSYALNQRLDQTTTLPALPGLSALPALPALLAEEDRELGYKQRSSYETHNCLSR